MTTTDRIRVAVYRTISTVNDLLPVDQPLAMNDNLVLVGPLAVLDSMGFVNFVVALEEELELEFRRNVDMGDLLTLQTSDGTTVSTVADLINVLFDRLG